MNNQPKAWLRIAACCSILLLGLTILLGPSSQANSQENPVNSSSCVVTDLGIPLVRHSHWPQHDQAFMHDLFLRTQCPNEQNIYRLEFSETFLPEDNKPHE